LHGIGIRSIEVKGLLHGAFGPFVQREWDANLKYRIIVEVKEVILSADCFVRDSSLIQNGAEFSVETSVIPLPKSAERILLGITRRSGSFGNGQSRAGFVFLQEWNVTVSANGEAFAILGLTFRANHHRRNSILLDGEGDCVAATKAKGGDAALQVATLQFVEQCDEDAGAACSNRMT
jgi:hypothetical protein